MFCGTRLACRELGRFSDTGARGALAPVLAVVVADVVAGVFADVRGVEADLFEAGMRRSFAESPTLL
jgi:hypothetical protein